MSEMLEESLVAANTRFAFKLFAELAQHERGKNIFISPASVFLALAMTYNGATGETQQGMAEVLELAGMSLDQVNRASAELLASLQSIDPQMRLAIANSLWGRQGIKFDKEFLRRCAEFYGAEVQTLDFADSRALATINGWVRKHTDGKIEKILDQIDGATLLVLLNAIYFKGNWTRPFDRQRTEERDFHLLAGGRKRLPLMAQSGEYQYYEDQGLQAVSLPYGGERLSMYLFLPEQRGGLGAFQQRLSDTNWNAWVRQFRKTEGTVALPRFKLEYEVTLNQALQKLGMAAAFSRRANFAGMGAGALKIDEVRHKTFVEVNEEGTEAAAVTAVTMMRASFVPKRRFRMVVDRPFFCAIRDNQSGAILFMGAIVDP
jgi:serine protease inhibitor